MLECHLPPAPEPPQAEDRSPAIEKSAKHLKPAGREELALAKALSDPRLRKVLASPGPAGACLLVAFDAADVKQLTQLGFAATSADGLSQIKVAQLEAVQRALGWNRTLALDELPPDATGDANQARTLPEASTLGIPLLPTKPSGVRVALVLVGFRLDPLDDTAPEGFMNTVAHLGKLERLAEIDLSWVCLWRPEPQGHTRLAQAHAVGDADLLRRVLLRELQDSLESLPQGAQQPTPAKNRTEKLLVARARMREHRSKGAGSLASAERVQAAEEQYRQCVSRELIEPLLRDKLATGDLAQQNLALVHAELLERMHEQSAKLTATASPAEVRGVVQLAKVNLQFYKEMSR